MSPAAAWTWASLAITYGIIFGTLALTPVIMPSGTPFGVRIPMPTPAIQQAVAQARRRFWVRLAAAGAATGLIAVLLGAERPALALEWIALGGLGLGFWAYYGVHRALKATKAAQRWYHGQPTGSAASLAPRETGGTAGPKGRVGGPDGFQLVALVMIVALVALMLLRYPLLPSRIPIHFGISGQPNGFMTKSYGAVLLVAATPAALTLGLLALARWLPRAQRRLDPAQPHTSEIQQEVFVHRSQIVLGLSADLVATQGLFTSLIIEGVLHSSPVLLLTSAWVPMLALVAAVVAIALQTGQGGSRVAVAEQDPPTGLVARDDDRYWRAGALYINRDDPALLVPKRVGFGYTINLGHPVSWVLLAAIVALLVLAPMLIRGHAP